jgi:transposase
MKKNSYVGMDLGDRNHEVCVLNDTGQVERRETVMNTAEAITKCLSSLPKGTAVAIEAGTHSGWISRLLETLGLHVVVAQPRKLRALWGRDRKNDASDAELLARMLRADPQLLHPIQHRSEQEQIDIMMLRSRDVLVQTRTKLINAARGFAKSLGHRLPAADARGFAAKARRDLATVLQPALLPLLDTVETLSTQIKALDRQIEELARARYPKTMRLREVSGVGSLTSLAFILTVADPARFRRSREVGPYLGLVPKQDQSGSLDKQLHITKAGDGYLRRLLVGSAQYILGPFGPTCGLRSFGLRLAARGGKNAKRRAVVAVARKLAVLLHKLWVSDAVYDPMRGLDPVTVATLQGASPA